MVAKVEGPLAKGADDFEQASVEVRIANRFLMGKKIGSGSFGEIFLGLDMVTGKEVAVKFESILIKRPQLGAESNILFEFHEEIGFPKFTWFGREGDYNIMVIELLGPSLEDLLAYCGHKFSLKTVLLLADQLLARL